jgi:hypothetical protein
MGWVQCRPQVALVVMVFAVGHGRVASAVALRLGLTGRHQSVEVELVGVALPVNFRHNVLVVVVPVNRSWTKLY